MRKNINKKGFTLVELLAVIVVLAIVMGLAVAGITGIINDARKNSFVADALMFLDGAHQLVTSDNVSSLFGQGSDYAPSCSGTAGDSKTIPVSAINLDQGGVKSPWGKPYDKTNSIIVVSSVISNGNCNYKYSIYLTDGVHSIGTKTAVSGDNKSGTIPEEQVNNSMVRSDGK